MKFTEKTKTVNCKQLGKTATLTIKYRIVKSKGEEIQIYESLKCSLRDESNKGYSCSCELEKLFLIQADKRK